MPEEEVNSYFDGHWYLMTPKPVYFTHAEKGGEAQPFKEDDAGVWDGVPSAVGGRMC